MNEKIIPLSIALPKMTGYIWKTDEANYMSLLFKNNDWLKKYKQIWYKISSGVENEYDSKPIYNVK